MGLRAAAFLAMVVVPLACSSFSEGSSPDGTVADAGNGGSADGAAVDLDAAGALDAGGPPVSGELRRITREASRTVGIATTTERIYWWSTADSRIASVLKRRPSQIDTFIARAGQTVDAVVADASGVYWIESGPDPLADAGISGRIMREEGGQALPYGRSTTPFTHLSMTKSFLAGLAFNSIHLAMKDGSMYRPVQINALGRVFGTDGFETYVANGADISAVDLSGSGRTVATLVQAAGLAFDGANLYTVIGPDADRRLVRMLKAGGSAPSGNVPVPSGENHLAVDSLGIIWANVNDGTVRRVDRSGVDATTIATGFPGINGLVADADGIYWTSEDGNGRLGGSLNLAAITGAGPLVRFEDARASLDLRSGSLHRRVHELRERLASARSRS